MNFHEAAYIKNIIINKSKGFGIRPGRETIGSVDEPDVIHSLDWFQDYQDQGHLLVGAGDKVYDDPEAAGIPAPSMSGLTVGQKTHNTSYQDFLWHCNGVDENKKFDGSAWSRAGMFAPAAAPTIELDAMPGDLIADEYQYVYTYVYKNAALNYEAESRISEISTLTVPALSAIDITVQADATGLASCIRVYRRSGEANEWQNVELGAPDQYDLPNVTQLYTDSNENADLGDIPDYPNEGEVLDIDMEPVALQGVTLFKSRLWGWAGAYLYYTIPGRPERWWNDASDYKPFLVDKQNNQDIICAIPYQNTLVIFTEDKMFMLTGDTEDEFNIMIRETNIGCISPRGPADCGGWLWWPSKGGVYRWNGFDMAEPMSEPINNDFDKYKRGILDNSVETMRDIAAEYIFDEDSYWLSTPKNSSENNPHTFPYFFKLKPMGISQWGQHNFGFKAIVVTNDKRVITADCVGYDYVLERVGIKDDGEQIEAYYETRHWNFDEDLLDKRLLEYTASAPGWGFAVKFSTKVTIMGYGTYVYPVEMTGLHGDFWGTDEPDAADDWWGTDEPDAATDWWEGTPEHHVMRNYPQECTGLRVGFRIDLSYTEDWSAWDLWTNSDKYTYTDPTLPTDEEDKYDIIKIDTDGVGSVYPLDTAGSNYSKLIHDDVGNRTFVLHYKNVNEATDAIVSIVNHNLPTDNANYITNINATATGWPAHYTTDVVHDMAFDPDNNRLAIAVSAEDGYAPALMVVNLSSMTCQVVAADTDIVGAGGGAGAFGYSRIRFVAYSRFRWWTLTFNQDDSGGGTSVNVHQIGYFTLDGEYHLTHQFGPLPPKGDTLNFNGNAYDSSVRYPNQPISCPPGAIAGTSYWGDPAGGLGEAIISFDTQNIGNPQLIITARPNIASWGTKPYAFGMEAFVYRFDVNDLISETNSSVSSFTIEVPAYDTGTHWQIDEGTTVVGPLDLSSIRGYCRVAVSEDHTGSFAGKYGQGNLHLRTNFGTINKGTGIAVGTPGCNHVVFSDEYETAMCGISYQQKIATYAAGTFTLRFTVLIYPFSNSMKDCIGIHSEEPLVCADDPDRPVTDDYTYRGYDWPVAQALYAAGKYTYVPSNYSRGCVWSRSNGMYVFPVMEVSTGEYRGMWTHTGAAVTRYRAATHDLEYDWVGAVRLIDDDNVVLVSIDAGLDNLSVQLFKVSEGEFQSTDFSAELGYSDSPSRDVVYSPKISVFGFCTGRDLADSGEMWFWRTPSPEEIEEGEKTYESIFENLIIENYFLGFEVAYNVEKRPHL